MRPVGRFALGAPAPGADPASPRPLLLDGRRTAQVEAAMLEAQFAVPGIGYLLLLSWDAPYEETPWLLLTDERGRPLDRHDFGGIVPAGATSRVRADGDRRLRLQVGVQDWVVEVRRAGMLGLGRPRLAPRRA